MTKIFISYRRQDTKLIVGRIFDRLKEKFGRDGVFMDIDSIPFGVDFREHLDREVSRASAVLVLIGHGWADAKDEYGRRRLDNPDDFVRIEIESALKRNIPVGAVLIDGAPIPQPDYLPESLRPLLFRNAMQLDAVRDFDTHMARLTSDLEQHFCRKTPSSPSEEKQLRDERWQPGTGSIADTAAMTALRPIAWGIAVFVGVITVLGAFLWLQYGKLSQNDVNRNEQQVNVDSTQHLPKYKQAMLTVQNVSGVAGEPVELKFSVNASELGNVLVRVDGLPKDAKLSSGIDVGSGRWLVAPARLHNLTVTLPSSLAGAFDLRVQLFRDDATTPLGEPARFVLTLTPQVSSTSQALIRDGNNAMRDGDILTARKLYAQAAADGNPEATLAMGRSYDPTYFEKLNIKTGKPDPATAFEWYKKAAGGGMDAAQVRIDALKQWLLR